MPEQWRKLGEGQTARLCTFDVVSGDVEIVLETDGAVIEAPNWTPDGRYLVVNREGLLYRVALQQPSGGHGAQPSGGHGVASKLRAAVVGGTDALVLVPTGDVRDANNDHVISPDGRFVYISSGDGHLYQADMDSGDTKRVSNHHDKPFRYFLHGISPDGHTLAYVGAQEVDGNPFGSLNIFTLTVAGGEDVQLTHSDKPNDGPEYSPDGEWIYFNSEMASETPGHAQIFKMRTDGSELTQLTSDERVNRFPHLSPDGANLVYISYEPGTTGHPPDRDVIIRSMAPGGGPAHDLVSLWGGQGTLNVNSWSPDSRRFVFVEYPVS